MIVYFQTFHHFLKICEIVHFISQIRYLNAPQNYAGLHFILPQHFTIWCLRDLLYVTLTLTNSV